MKGYLGETFVTSLVGTPFEGWDRVDWASHYIRQYGSIDGGRHQRWLLDQILRILQGTPMEVKLAKWDDGTEEYRFSTLEPSDRYREWVASLDFEHDPGVAP